MSPGSSESVEHPVLYREAPGSNPGPGSTCHYVVVRKELRADHQVAHIAHAAGESASLWTVNQALACGARGAACNGQEHLLPADTTAVVLEATKAQLRQLLDVLLRENVPHKPIVETTGQIAGMLTAVGVVTQDKAALVASVPLLGELPRWRHS